MLITFTLFIVALVSAWVYMKHSYSYWSSKGVKGPDPQPIIGHFSKLQSGEFWTIVKQYYEDYKSQGYYGTYEMLKPTIALCDPDHIKNVLVKDFDYFVNRREIYIGETYISEMLFMLNGNKWKALRSIMTPAFSSGKMKHMYGTIVNKIVENFLSRCERDKNLFDSKDIFGRYTMSVISSSAFGMETNSLSGEDCPFANAADDMFQTNTTKMIKVLLVTCLPRVFDLLGLSIDDDSMRFFDKCCKEVIKQRRESGEFRGDFLDLLLVEQKKQKDLDPSKIEYIITEDSIVAQSVLFLMTGYDTTANLLTFSSYYLAKHPDHQDTLRQELQDIVEEKEFDYYKLMEAPFLDACCSETLRLNPPLAQLDRQCQKDYRLPNTDIIITKGMIVQIPIWGIHRNKDYWEDPELFDPYRFMPENKGNIRTCTHMPFGYGPRNCIAMRFALMEAKLCIAKMILKYKLHIAPGHEELKLEAGDGVVRVANGSVKLILSDV